MARQISQAIIHKCRKCPAGKAGLIVGRRDHATVLHSCRQVTNLYETDKYYRSQVDKILSRLCISNLIDRLIIE